MTPDIIINPHAFLLTDDDRNAYWIDGRKVGACHGVYQDSTPFQFHEKQYAFEYLRTAEASWLQLLRFWTVDSGIDGKELHADILLGAHIINVCAIW